MERISFPSKVDRWLGVLLVISAAVSVAGVVIVGIEASPMLAVFLSPVMLLGAALPLWLLRATRYTIDSSDLHIRCGPFAWRVPFHEIRSITPTRSPLSSPALSLDRLRIDFGRAGSIMVSPRDKERFLEEVRKRVPAA
jgi:membrane protein YdbS with pleckstrin-like domain